MNLFDLYRQEPVYFTMALSATLLFLIKTIMMLLLGDFGEMDSDFDLDADLDGEHPDSSSAFQLFSLQSILAFFMGMGWMGLALRRDGFNHWATIALASGVGFFLMFISSYVMFSMKKLNRKASYDLMSCVGATARVYLTIPAKGEGEGQVEINVGGRQKIFQAVSDGPKFEAFKSVRIVSVDPNSETLSVSAPE